MTSLLVGLPEVDFHIFVTGLEQIGHVVAQVVDVACEMYLESGHINGLAMIGENLARAIDDGLAEFQQTAVADGLENDLVADAIGVALRDAHAYFLFIVIIYHPYN